MKQKIFDYEIEEILKENPRELIPLSEIREKLKHNRQKRKKEPVSKTTVYTALEKMVEKKKLHHVNRKGYMLLNYDFTESDPNFKYFRLYKKLANIMGFIFITKSGALDEQPELMDNFKEDINEMEWNEFKRNFKKLIEQGILEIKDYYKQSRTLDVNYYWALYHDLCPVCLEKIDLNEPHFALEFLEDEAAYIMFAKAHIPCVESLLHKYELKKEYESESSNYNPWDEFSLEAIHAKEVHFTCPYCGFTLDLYELFLDEKGPLEDIYKKLQIKGSEGQILTYLQNLCKELYGDISTLAWAKEIRFKKVRLVIKKIIMHQGRAYHPNCAIKEDKTRKLFKSVNRNTKEEPL